VLGRVRALRAELAVAQADPAAAAARAARRRSGPHAVSTHRRVRRWLAADRRRRTRGRARCAARGVRRRGPRPGRAPHRADGRPPEPLDARLLPGEWRDGGRAAGPLCAAGRGDAGARSLRARVPLRSMAVETTQTLREAAAAQRLEMADAGVDADPDARWIR